jgi:ketosteroid isomerase-like protein
VTQDNPDSRGAQNDEGPEEQLVERKDQPEGKDIEDFFQRLPGSFRWPKPNAEAVAAAVEAVHRMSGGGAAQDLAAAGEAELAGNTCSGCGGALAAGARFCGSCGLAAHAGDAAALSSVPASASARPTAGQHHVHHHYHHFVPGPGGSGVGALFGAGGAEAEASAAAGSSAPRGRAPGSAGAMGGRAEAGARQVALDWAQACNTRHIDDLIELYAADATLIRSSVPPVRSLPAIREFLISLLEAGLGDVEMESLRLEIMGDIALDLGRCKMLVPVAMGKRREERGKYLVVLVRQPAGTWKILADCWSADLAVSAPPEAAPRKGEATPPGRKTR